jgi:hypothetical protein
LSGINVSNNENLTSFISGLASTSLSKTHVKT